MGGSFDKAATVSDRKLQLVGEIRTGVEEMRADAAKLEMSLVNMSIGHLETGKEGMAISACSSCHTKETVDQQKKRFNAAGATIRRHLAEMRLLTAADQDRAMLDQVEDKVAEWFRLYDTYLELSWKKDFDAAHEVMLEKIYPLVESIGAQLGQASRSRAGGACRVWPWTADPT